MFNEILNKDYFSSISMLEKYFIILCLLIISFFNKKRYKNIFFDIMLFN